MKNLCTLGLSRFVRKSYKMVMSAGLKKFLFYLKEVPEKAEAVLRIINEPKNWSKVNKRDFF